MSGKVLILGASGRFGRHAAEAFWNAGWQVRIFDRATDDLMAAAAGVDVIVNAWNPPYIDWARDVPAMTDQVIDAARTSGATVIIPGNVYGYGHGAPPVITSDTPMAATNPLGRIRIAMEAAYRASGVRTIVLRAGDFIDTEASGNWFDMIITAKLAKGVVVAPGAVDVPHAWAYLPDVARAAVELAEKREGLDTFEEVLFPGFTLSLHDLAALISTITGRPMRVKRMNWLPLWCLSPVWRMAGKLIEMRYLWTMPHALDGVDMARLLPKFRATDSLAAITTALGQHDVNPDQTMPRGAFDVAAE